MENIKTKEVVKPKKPEKGSTLIFVAALLFLISSALYIVHFIEIRETIAVLVEYKIWDWGLVQEFLNFLVALALAVMTFLASTDSKHLKKLVFPSFAGAIVVLYPFIAAIVKNGIGAMDTFFVLVSVFSALAYIFLGIYAIKKGIAIVFAAAFSTYTAALMIWFNAKEIVAIVKAASLKGALMEIMQLALAVGILILVWACVIYFYKKTDGKDIIKKNIALAIVVSIVTLGIYAVIWLKSISDDISKLEGKEVNSTLETALILTVPFFCLFWFCRKGKILASLADDANMSALYAVQAFFLLGLFAMGLMQGQLHRAIGLHK